MAKIDPYEKLKPSTGAALQPVFLLLRFKYFYVSRVPSFYDSR